MRQFTIIYPYAWCCDRAQPVGEPGRARPPAARCAGRSAAGYGRATVTRLVVPAHWCGHVA